jgi:hypothetical protein
MGSHEVATFGPAHVASQQRTIVLFSQLVTLGAAVRNVHFATGQSRMQAVTRPWPPDVTGEPLARLVNRNMPDEEKSWMTNVMSSRFADAVLNAGGLCMVIVGIAAIDERVRTYLDSLLTGDPSSELVHASVRAQRFARIAMDAADVHSSEPLALAAFAVVAVLLGTFMLRP